MDLRALLTAIVNLFTRIAHFMSTFYTAVTTTLTSFLTAAEQAYRARANSPVTTVAYAVVGVTSAAAASFLLSAADAYDIHDVVLRMSVAALAASLLYCMAYLMRSDGLFRHRFEVRGDFLCGVGVTVLTLLISLVRQISYRALFAQFFLVFSVFTFFLILRPANDYGISNIFMRLPLQTAAFMLREPENQSCFGFLMLILAFLVYLPMFYLNLVVNRWNIEMEVKARANRELIG